MSYEKDCHKKLLLTLDVLSDTADWVEFMRSVETFVPELMTKGRMTDDAIKGSFFGKLGFTSWKEYVETSRKHGGLGWKYNGWRGYQRAWKVTAEHSWLEESEMKPGTINAFVAECKKREVDFPSCIEEYQALKASWDEEKKQPEQEQEPEKPLHGATPVKLTFMEWLAYPFKVGFK